MDQNAPSLVYATLKKTLNSSRKWIQKMSLGMYEKYWLSREEKDEKALNHL